MRIQDEKPISDERLSYLDHWYEIYPSNSLKFCDQDYWQMRNRMKLMQSVVEAAKELDEETRGLETYDVPYGLVGNIILAVRALEDET